MPLLLYKTSNLNGSIFGNELAINFAISTYESVDGTPFNSPLKNFDDSPATFEVAGALATNLKTFRCGFITDGTSNDAVVMAKDVVQYLRVKDGEKISFSILYSFEGIHHVYGYIYEAVGHNHGIIHVDIANGSTIAIFITDDNYNVL